MANKTLRNLDIYVPEFDYQLLCKIDNMTPEQKEQLPTELAFKIFKLGTASVEKLTFTEKMYILSVCFKQDIIIVTQDSETGIGPKDFRDAVSAQRGKIKNGELLKNMQIPTLFVQGDKELMRALLYMNHIQCSEIFNIIRSANPRNKSKRELKFEGYQRALTNLIRMLTHYEGTKKNVIVNFNLSVPKLYALMYFFDGEKRGKDFYTVAFKHAYTSNRSDLGGALAELYQSGHLSRRGNRNTMRYAITSKGIELLTRILNKLIYNYNL